MIALVLSRGSCLDPGNAIVASVKEARNICISMSGKGASRIHFLTSLAVVVVPPELLRGVQVVQGESLEQSTFVATMSTCFAL